MQAGIARALAGSGTTALYSTTARAGCPIEINLAVNNLAKTEDPAKNDGIQAAAESKSSWMMGNGHVRAAASRRTGFTNWLVTGHMTTAQARFWPLKIAHIGTEEQ